jgi:hypothetical protein
VRVALCPLQPLPLLWRSVRIEIPQRPAAESRRRIGRSNASQDRLFTQTPRAGPPGPGPKWLYRTINGVGAAGETPAGRTKQARGALNEVQRL